MGLFELSLFRSYTLAEGRDGGIGRRTRLKIVRSNPWEFDSPSRHKQRLCENRKAERCFAVEQNRELGVEKIVSGDEQLFVTDSPSRHS